MQKIITKNFSKVIALAFKYIGNIMITKMTEGEPNLVITKSIDQAEGVVVKPVFIPLTIFTKPSRYVNKVFLHCSDSNVARHDNIETIKQWHIEGNGWVDVGYHFFIQSDGTIETGRDIEKKPASQKGHNQDTISICLHGKNKEDFTVSQIESLTNLCQTINEAYNKDITFHGHCEVSTKPCPVFDYKEVLKLDEKGKFSCKEFLDN